MNPFHKLYAECNAGDPALKWGTLRDFPRIIDVELTSRCNFRCLMCPTGNRSLKRDGVDMDFKVGHTIVEQAKEGGAALRFIGWGEPTMHPELDLFISIASAGSNRVPTHVNTNGWLLEARMARHLIYAGLTSIKFSFQGIDRDGYKAMRQRDFFPALLEKIGMFRAMRDDLGYERPYISVSTSITDETLEQVHDFVARVDPLVDEISIGHTTFDFMDLSAIRLNSHQRETLMQGRAAQSVERRHPDPCPEVYDKLSIHADGRAHVCCNDFDGITQMGNVIETPIKEIWRHKVIEEYRARLARREYSGPLCSVCYDYMGCTKKESSNA